MHAWMDEAPFVVFLVFYIHTRTHTHLPLSILLKQDKTRHDPLVLVLVIAFLIKQQQAHLIPPGNGMRGEEGFSNPL